MKEVNIEAGKLIETLKENRKTHIKDFKESYEKYRSAAIRELGKNYRKAKKGGELVTYIALEAPISYEKSYDTVIKMLEMNAGGPKAPITLTHQEFSQYVEDNWQWKQAFSASNAFYKSVK